MEEINDYANQLKIDFIVDVFGYKSLETAEKLKLNAVKIHATDLSNTDLIKKIIIQNQYCNPGVGGHTLMKLRM